MKPPNLSALSGFESTRLVAKSSIPIYSLYFFMVCKQNELEYLFVFGGIGV
jgi:hypothetical protein